MARVPRTEVDEATAPDIDEPVDDDTAYWCDEMAMDDYWDSLTDGGEPYVSVLAEEVAEVMSEDMERMWPSRDREAA